VGGQEVAAVALWLKGGTDKSQAWLTFLRNHLQVSWAMDFLSMISMAIALDSILTRDRRG
jgi:hypothetical protein